MIRHNATTDTMTTGSSSLFNQPQPPRPGRAERRAQARAARARARRERRATIGEALP